MLLAFSLIIGGALSNGIDRVARGFVVDFLRPHWGGARFAVYNLADLCILVGFGLMALFVHERWRSNPTATQQPVT